MKWISALALVLLPMPAFAQMVSVPPRLPLVADLGDTTVGSWAEYFLEYSFGLKVRSRWALVERDTKSVVLEASNEGAILGGRVTERMVLVADSSQPGYRVTEVIVQMGNNDPMLHPPDRPKVEFRMPVPSTLVGKEKIKVRAGTFVTSHYREDMEMGTVDVWISEDVPPLGLIKLSATHGERRLPEGIIMYRPTTMELSAKGKRGRPVVTKPARPWDAEKLASELSPQQRESDSGAAKMGATSPRTGKRGSEASVCAICGKPAIGHCHLRDIYVCQVHRYFTDSEGRYGKPGTRWSCP